MRWSTLDNITRSVLFQAGYPIHWYMQFLKYSVDCLRELTFDTLQVVNTKNITLEEGKYAQLPCDYVDWVHIGTTLGQYRVPMVESKSISQLHNYDSNGNIVNYGTGSASDSRVFGAINWNTANEYNEPTGRFYGLGNFPSSRGFKVLRNRGNGHIQFDEQMPYTSIQLEYISDGQTIDSATKVHPYAIAAIEAYIIWKMKEYGRHYNRQDAALCKQQFDQLHRNLRGRLNPLTIDDYKQIIRGAYTATNKI